MIDVISPEVRQLEKQKVIDTLEQKIKVPRPFVYVALLSNAEESELYILSFKPGIELAINQVTPTSWTDYLPQEIITWFAQEKFKTKTMAVNGKTWRELKKRFLEEIDWNFKILYEEIGITGFQLKQAICEEVEKFRIAEQYDQSFLY